MPSFYAVPRISRACCLILFVAVGVCAALDHAKAQSSPAPAAALKIVVIAGEDAVNIIQQKTAVAPIVEVRDRNDLPVAGATVTFTIGGGNTATFAGGAQTLTVATNAAGRAAVTALNPVASGVVQINVQAVFQGQAAVATITQTNVLAAAEAAAAGSGTATGSGGAAGSGGGLSNGAIAGVAGAAGAGAVGAALAAGGQPEEPASSKPATYTGSFTADYTNSVLSPTQTCVSTSVVSGTLTMTLQQGPGGAFTGNAVADDARTVTAISSPTCNQVNLGRTFGDHFSVPVSGTESALAFNSPQPYSTSGEVTGSGVKTLTFLGGIATGVVTGTLTFVDTSEGTGNVGQPLVLRGSWTSPVTLR